MAKVVFEAKLDNEGMTEGWAHLALSKSASAKFPSRGIVPIAGTINGFAFRSSAAPDGKGGHRMMINAAMRAGAKASVGDRVTMAVEHDTASREPDLPSDLAKALSKAKMAKALWEEITPRARGEWVEFLDEAKRPETRVRRVAKVVERLAAGVRRRYD